MSKMDSLQSALNSTANRRPVQPVAVPSEKTETPDHNRRLPSRRAASRKDAVNFAAWLPSDYKKSVRLIQAKRQDDPSLQDLMAEAFNDLFVKYNVPTISE